MEITVEAIVFLVFSAITLGGALQVVLTRNLFHAALYLMLSLFGVAGLFVLLTAPFLAGAQVVIYIGAITILIIFAIMLTPQVTRVLKVHHTQWPVALALAALLFVGLVWTQTPLADELGADGWSADFTVEDPADVPADSLTDLGKSLVDPERYMLPFEAASLLLMAALIGAVLLVNRPDDNPDAEAAPAAGARPDQSG
ncbi:MAG: NADH-quinone oxidoreductase subunit J [Anaerolineae bacterium]|nr:NADH-quinone oxidoreductase subunit J [Anaerolineae bacterium]